MIKTIATFLLMILATSAHANNPAELAARATEQLRSATASLVAADSTSDRVTALTKTIRAFENGLQSMREGLRAAAVRERVLRREFDNRRDQISQLLGVLLTLERASTPMLMIHPEGAVGTARSGMMVSEVAPTLQQEAEKLRAQLQELANLQRLQKLAEEDLLLSLDGVQKARVALTAAMGQRTELPNRLADDPIKIQILADNSTNLEYFAKALAAVPLNDLDEQPEPFPTAKGRLSLPASGSLLRQYQEADAAGLERPGILIATPALSLVSAPWPATVRYSGPFLDYGNVIILEPEVGYLIILAGLNQVYSKVGEIVAKGAPLGLLGGQVTQVDDFLIEATAGGNTTRQETLYIEIRENGAPVNPLPWFALEQK